MTIAFGSALLRGHQLVAATLPGIALRVVGGTVAAIVITVVALRLSQDLPYARIAEMVGCTEPTVRSHMHHGLAALRVALAGLQQRASR